MNKNIILLLSLVLVGCISIEVQNSSSGGTGQKQELTKINQVKVGMTHQAVINILDENTTVGYKQDQYPGGSFEPMSVPNPYRIEMLRGKNKEYNIAYYLTDVKKTDDLIADDELTPLIFADGILVGKGWDYLFRLKKRLEL